MKTANRRENDKYFELVRAFPLRPIRTEADAEQAIAVLTRISLSKPEEKMEDGERDYSEALTLLVQQFERGRTNSALPRLSPIDRLKFLMNERGMSINDLGRVIGSQPNASLILHGKRSMSKTQIIKLSHHFAVSPGLFIE
jgi:HTH-type transcriptional regulator/antitoxin HigA